MSDQPILVCGFLGAGKSTLRAQLHTLGHPAVELDGLQAPSAVAAGEKRRVITVVDCANAVRQMEDPLTGPLLQRQLGAAGLVVLSRSDLADPAPVRAMAASIAECPVVDARMGALPADALSRLAPRALGPSEAGDDLTAEFGSWIYEGGALFRSDQAERLIAKRPSRIERLSGVLRTDGGGLEVQLVGRMRQTQPVPSPEQTSLEVRWRRSGTTKAEIDLWFAESVSDSGHRRGLFGYR